MKSTGEVMGIDANLGLAIAKSQLAAGATLPRAGTVFISVRDADKKNIVPVAKDLTEMGYTIIATKGTAAWLKEYGVACERVNKISEGRPHIHDRILSHEVAWLINTSLGKRANDDSYTIRRAALEMHLPYTTTVTGAAAVTKALRELRQREIGVRPVQDFNNRDKS